MSAVPYGLDMNYIYRRYIFFRRYSTNQGHFILFLDTPFSLIYISSFPSVLLRKFYIFNYSYLPAILKRWQNQCIKPTMIPFPESRPLRRKLFKELVRKPNEK